MTTATAKTQTQAEHRPQIFVVKTNKNVFEVLDGLDLDPKHNKIQVNLLDYTQNPSVFVSHSINPDVMLVLCHDIINGTFKDYMEYKGSAHSRREDGKPEARTLSIKLREKASNGEPAKYPYTISIATGIGQVIGQGAVKMVKQEHSVNMVLSLMDMRRMAVTVTNYIRDFEQFHRFQSLKAKA